MRAAWLFVLLGALSSPASAQQDVFRDALIGFHAKLAGLSGDEGPDLVRRLDGMAAALASWHYTYAAALRAADAAVAASPDRASLHVARGLLLEAMGRPQDALAAFTRAWALDREDAVSAYLAASRGASPKNPDDVPPPVARLLSVLDRRLASVRPDRHIELFPEVALVPDNFAVTPVFAPALYADGFILIAQARYPEALASFRKAAARDPLIVGGPGEAHRRQAAKYADAGDDSRSLEELEAAVRLAPDDERASVALGRALDHGGMAVRAERVLLDILSKLPRSADAHSALADLYERSGRGRDALREVEATAALPVPAGKGALYLRLADLHHRFLEYGRVIEPLATRVRLDPNAARAHTDLGLAYVRIGRTGDALREFIMATLLGPEDGEALAGIGQIHFDAGNVTAAVAVLQRSVLRSPDSAQAHYLLGQALARLGRDEESRRHLAEFDRLRELSNDSTRRAFEKEDRPTGR